MYSSVLAGVKALGQNTDGFFILPADMPLVKSATYRSLIDAFYESYDSPEAIYPTFLGQRGHPPLAGREMIGPILGWSGERGLSGLLEKCSRSLDVPTADRGVTLDMDTHEDYNSLLKYAITEKFPDDDECAELLGIAGTPNRVVRHMKAVAASAMRLADALNDSGAHINKRMLASACLLHDIAKGEKEHEARGARWLRERGYSKVADLVASHKDLPEKKSIGEAELLYLADKITDGESVSTLKNRMLRMEARFAPWSDSLEAARRRIKRASEIQKKVEKITGLSIEELLRHANYEY
jgi:hypothetical protein